MPMKIKGKLHSSPFKVEHVEVLEDGGVAETPEIIANMNNDKPKKESRKDIF